MNKRNIIKTILVIFCYTLIAFILLLGLYYYQLIIKSIFFYTLLILLVIPFLVYINRKVTEDFFHLLIVLFFMLVSVAPLKILVMNTFDSYLFTNEHIRTRFVKKTGITFVEALGNADKSRLKKLSPQSSNQCEGDALRMASTTYSDYYGKDLEIIDLKVFHSNQEDTDSFVVKIKYLEESKVNEVQIRGVTLLKDGRFYICGENF